MAGKFNKRAKANIMLFLAAVFWGFAFVAQKDGGEALGAVTFNGTRALLGAFALYLSTFFLDRIGVSHKPATEREKKDLWTGGIVCGLALFLATNLQQLGINSTSPGKSGFVTALYIVLVPFFGLFIGQKITWLNWVGIAVAVGGLYLLCFKKGDGFTSVATGDLYLLACAVLFSVQILAVSKFSPKVDGVRLSCIQFLVTGVLSVPLMFTMEEPDLSAIAAEWPSLLYAGLFSCGAAYTLQILAQRDAEPSTATLIMSLESVFAALFGWLTPKLVLTIDPNAADWQKMAESSAMTGRQILGGALMFAAILLAQLPPPKFGKKKA